MVKLCTGTQGRAGQGRAGQGRAGQGRAGQGRAGQGRAGQGRAGQGRAGQGRAGQGRAGQGRAGQGRAGQGRTHGAVFLCVVNYICYCVLHMLLSVTDWTVLLWVCCITFNLYWNVVRMKPSEQFERFGRSLIYLFIYYTRLMKTLFIHKSLLKSTAHNH